MDDVSPSGNALFILATYEHVQLWFTLLRGVPDRVSDDYFFLVDLGAAREKSVYVRVGLWLIE